MTLLMDDVQEIRARWKNKANAGTAGGAVADAITDVEILCSEVELLDVAWRAAEDACLDYSRELAHLTGLLLKAKQSGALPADLMESIDKALEE